MTQVENREQLQLQLMQYLYGDMSESERAQFDQQLQENPLLRDMLDQEQRFDAMLPIGSQPLIDPERLQGNRWLLRQNLQRQRQSFSLRSWYQGLAERPFAVAMQGLAMAATFVLGILVATPDTGELTSAVGAGFAVAAASPLDLIDNEDFEIYQLKVNSYDASSGAIDLSFSLASETRVTGNVADQGIHRLMAVALQDDIDSSARLDTINALQTVSSGSDVFAALIHVLKNDENPGVRYQAVQSLTALAAEEQVRDALRYALSEDVNPGVRLEAFQALTRYPDSKTLEVFRRQMDADSNEYIRTQARSIIEGTDNAAIEL